MEHFQDTCDLCEERCPMMFEHPDKENLLVCYFCYQEALESMYDDPHLEERLDTLLKNLPF